MTTRKKKTHTIDFGRTMLEMLAVLAMIGLITVGGASGIKYGMDLYQAYQAQQQVNDLSKGVQSLYAWMADYSGVTMSGSKGICENDVLRDQKCDKNYRYASPWGGTIEVRPGNSNSSFTISFTDMPGRICRIMSGMNFTRVEMQNKNCALAYQTVEFSAEKSDGVCENGCPGKQVCQGGVCVCANGGLGESCIVPDLCPTMNCSGECYTGECKDNTCVAKPNGTTCSGGTCYYGTCEYQTESQTETVSDTPCDAYQLLGSDGKCYNCSEPQALTGVNCSDCDGTPYQRTLDKSEYGSCALAKCPSGMFRDANGSCIDCSDPNDAYIGSDGPSGGWAQECIPNCANTPYPRRIVGQTYCVLGEETTFDEHTTTWDETTTYETVTQEETTTELECGSNQFEGYDGKCYDCSNKSEYIFASSSECGKCGNSSTPREMMGQYCILKDCPNGFKDSNGSCHLCSYNNYVVSNEVLCSACDNTAYPREVRYTSSGSPYCARKNCDAGYMQDSWGNCISCNTTSSVYLSDKTQCDMCGNTGYAKRVLMGNYCRLSTESCPDGQFMSSNGCQNCSVTSSVTSNAEQCAKCNGTAYPRTMLSDQCVLTQNCPAGQFLSRWGCVACNSTSGTYTSSEQECAKCDSTYPRVMIDNLCLPKRTCSNGYFLKGGGSNSSCVACSDTAAHVSSSELCAACNGTSNPRQMIGNKCVLNACASGYFRDSSDNCVSCETTPRTLTTANECAVCNNTSYPREMQDGYCIRKTCPSGSFWTKYGQCVSCSTSSGYYQATAQECAKCGSQRTMMGDNCVYVKSCPSGQMLGSAGCSSCSATYAITSNATYCAACDATSYPREMSTDGYCMLKTTCPAGQYMSGLTCYPCSETTARNASANQCAKCDTTSTPREMMGSACVLSKTCGSGYFASTAPNGCASCSTTSAYASNARQCAACEGTGYPRKMVDDKCVLTSCPTNHFLSTLGCMICSHTNAYESTTTECNKCSEREMVSDKCTLKCPVGQFHGSDGVCYSCSSLLAPESTTALCLVCNNVSINRHLVNGRCVLPSN